MANEEFYKNMAASLATAKKQLAAAEDLISFANAAGMPITVDMVTVAELNNKIVAMEAALVARGYAVA